MQVSVETTGKLERRIEVHVPAEHVEKAIDERLKRMSRTVRLKGFRPGKAPVKVVRQQFGQQVRQEVLSDLMQSSFVEAVSQEKLTPAGGPRIEPISLESGQDLKYRATFEIFPEIELQGLEGMEVTRPQAAVSPADVDAMLENLRSQRPRFLEVDRECRDTDRVMIDFDGRIGEESFEGGKGEDVFVILGSGRMLPDFEAGIRGARAGDERKVEVNFPADYQANHLAGKTAAFDVKVKKVEEQTLPELDEEFCRSFGVEAGGLEQLRSEVADNMSRELEDNVRARLKQQVLDKLLASNPIDVPPSLVESQIRDMQVEAGRRMGAKDVSQLPPPEPFRESAKRRVALGLLINELIRSREIKLDRARVQNRLDDLVAQYPEPEQMMKAYRDNREVMRQIEMMVFEEQVVDWLLERAKITDQETTFKELMNFGA